MPIFVRASSRAKAYTRNISLNLSGVKLTPKTKLLRSRGRASNASYNALQSLRKQGNVAATKRAYRRTAKAHKIVRERMVRLHGYSFATK